MPKNTSLLMVLAGLIFLMLSGPIAISRLHVVLIPRFIEESQGVEIRDVVLNGDPGWLSPDVDMTIETREGITVALERLDLEALLSRKQLTLRSANGLRPDCVEGRVGTSFEGNLIEGPRCPFSALRIDGLGGAIPRASLIVAEMESWPREGPTVVDRPEADGEVSRWVARECAPSFASKRVA